MILYTLKMNNKAIFFLVLIVYSSLLFGQDLKTTEIKVEEGFMPEIPEANRLNQKASFQDTANEIIEQKYILIEEKLNSDYQIKPLSSAKVKSKNIPSIKPFNFYISGGNIFSLKGLYNSKIEDDISYGILFDNTTTLFKVRRRKANSTFNKIHIIGNPPFGRQSSLAIKFIKKSVEYCDSISFILPKRLIILI